MLLFLRLSANKPVIITEVSLKKSSEMISLQKLRNLHPTPKDILTHCESHQTFFPHPLQDRWVPCVCLSPLYQIVCLKLPTKVKFNILHKVNYKPKLDKGTAINKYLLVLIFNSSING